MKDLKFIDATLRDGSHAIKHQLTKENIIDYCNAVDDAGLYSIVVGHGNGLGASSLQVGLSLLKDDEMLSVARKSLKSTKLGTYMIPGFGTIEDNLRPAMDIGVDLFKIGCHCTEADTTRQHIEFLRNNGKEVVGVLMMYHFADKVKLLEESKKMQSYGANGVLLMDSAGASTPQMVKEVISFLVENLDVEVGFHAHNNLGLAVGNTLIAIEEGATIVDGTIRGFGAGAGNCQLECVIAVLEKMGVSTGVDLYKIFDAGENIIRRIEVEKHIDKKGQGANSIVSGINGVFSAFKVHVLNAAKNFNINSYDIYKELGKRKAVAGQEDMIIEIAEKLSKEKKNDSI